MAAVVQLENYSATQTINLLTGVLKMTSESWSTRTPPIQGDYTHSRYGATPSFDYFGVQVEEIDLFGKDTPANLAIAANTIEDALEEAELYFDDPMFGDSWWLRAYADGEQPKRCLLYRGSIRYSAYTGVGPLMPRSKLRANLALSRHPLWESTAVFNVNQANVSCAGGTWDTAAVLTGGTSPGRISEFRVDGRSGGGGPIVRLWAGIRPIYQGYTNFSPVLEIELGDETDADTAEVVDAAASGGKYVRTTFATDESLIIRTQIPTTSLWSGGTSKELVGSYWMLLRMRTTGASTVGIQVRAGFRDPASGNEQFALTNTPVYADNANWRICVLGLLHIPPMGYPKLLWDAKFVKNFYIQIMAERLEGSGNFEYDVMYLIPSRHQCFADGAGVIYSLQGDSPLKFYTFADDDNLALWWRSMPGPEDIPIQIPPPSFMNWYYPLNGGLLVLVAERDTEHFLTDTVDLGLYVYKRYRSLRGTA